jgi:hypothetical protein
LIKTTIERRPRKAAIARAVPTGKLKAVAATVAATLTQIEIDEILHSWFRRLAAARHRRLTQVKQSGTNLER